MKELTCENKVLYHVFINFRIIFFKDILLNVFNSITFALDSIMPNFYFYVHPLVVSTLLLLLELRLLLLELLEELSSVVVSTLESSEY